MDAKVRELLGGVPAIEIVDFLIEERKLNLRDLERMYSRLENRHRIEDLSDIGLDDPIGVDNSCGCCIREE